MTFWRITIIYILSLLFVGLLVPYNDERLVGGSYGEQAQREGVARLSLMLYPSSDANTSPFVIVFDRANVPGLPHLINATITVSVLSIGMSCVYAGSRTLLALAEQGYAPKFFTYVDKAGRPTWAVLFIIAFFPVSVVIRAFAGMRY